MAEVLKVGVVGCGRMGRLHARIYAQMPQAALVGVYDVSRPAAEAVAAQHGCRVFGSIDEMAAEVQAATIATPTEFHAAMAEPLLRRGISCLIEKPLAPTAEVCRRIVECARAGGATLQVGHSERFNPAVQAVSRLGVSPRYIETVRVSPLTFRSLDVGVVLDMMIHDLDIVAHLAGARVKKVDASGVSVLGSAEDVCSARLVFENGCVAHVTASRLALKTERRLRIVCNDAYIAVDYAKKEGVVAHRTANLETIRETARKVRAGEITDLSQVNYASLVKLEKLKVEGSDVEPLRAEQEAFLAAVSSGNRPIVSGEDGMTAVELAEKIVAAMGNPSLP